ncbi:MAG: hypothetical protein ACFHVJ_11020 [Aestuariibacter sp.]
MKSVKKILVVATLSAAISSPVNAGEVSLYDSIVNYFFGGVVARHGDNKPDPNKATIESRHGDNKPDPE